ncbi:MAG: CRISPR-associated helicase Cas3', partial [Atribacterota bacterium]|nr:CRISPR-associated helicase Cas3' [Atribacterota bacterium]
MIEFYSHLEPNKILLKDHLKDVGSRSKRIIQAKRLDEIDELILADISYLIGISHDFGKYTTFFQKKLKGMCDKNDFLARHGLISALFMFEVAYEYVRTKNLKNIIPYEFLPLFSYFVVKRHHLDLGDIEDDISVEKLFDSDFRYISKQFEDIWQNKKQIKKEYNALFINYPISSEIIFNNLEKYKKNIKYSSDIEEILKELDISFYSFRMANVKTLQYYFIILLLYSVLIDSDKKYAGGVKEIERKIFPENLVENYLNKDEFKEEGENNINCIRNEIRKSVLRNIGDPKNKHQKIYTLTAPTGTGKTLASLSAALLLRNKLKKYLNLKNEPRIIYSLPFTSIIDQNYTVFDKVLNQIEDFRAYENEYLLKHHHLSEIFYKTEGVDRERDVEESLALIESWESEIIVTTFIQLFYTLIGHKNCSLKKFHNIVNSIILLDEIQNIPVKYWNLVREVLIGMTKYYNCRVILITATKPLIFQDGEYIELVEDYEKYFSKPELNRVCLEVNLNKRYVLNFYNSLVNWSQNSYLFVFNTIGSSLEFYSLLSRDKFKENEIIIYKEEKKKLIINKIIKGNYKYDLYYLSSNVIPKIRRERIELIKKRLENNHKAIIISTQLIEAGVDIDCECVYRDLGPLDSIIQVAGRCNRNKKLHKGNTYLVNLMKMRDSGSEYWYANIYDKVLLNIVTEILNGKKIIYEKDFLDLINDYFMKAKEKSNIETNLTKSLYSLYFYDKNPDNKRRKPISEFKLIEEKDWNNVDIFVELDDEAQRIYTRYQEIKEIKNLWERKNEFLKIRKDFYDYVISIPYQYAGDFIDNKGISY